MTGDRPLDLSIVAPAHNEEENLRPFVAEIVMALEGHDLTYEIIVVDDGSTDGTAQVLSELLAEYPMLRAVHLHNPRLSRPPDPEAGTPSGVPSGQSAALYAGVRCANGALVATLDADLQNDPADLPPMIDRLHATAADMVQGDRSQTRRDSLVRRLTSRVGRLFRRWLLADPIRDTGCSLRVMRRDLARRLPLEFKGMHRFIPVTARHLGATVVEVPVNHRARRAGRAKYGVWNRAIPGLIDCFAVRWMRARRRTADVRPIEPAGDVVDTPPEISVDLQEVGVTDARERASR